MLRHDLCCAVCCVVPPHAVLCCVQTFKASEDKLRHIVDTFTLL